MGCWNHTCAVTNLPVYEGDDVVVVLLKSATTKYSPSFCYPFGYHIPLPLTFQGKYNDYGAVEECHGPALNIIIDCIRAELVEMELGENEYHDIEVKKKDFDVDALFNADHENRLRIGNTMREERNIKHTVIHQAVWDGIVNQTKFESWDRDTSETIYYGYEELKQEMVQYVADLREITPSSRPDDDASIEDLIKYVGRLDGRVGETYLTRIIASRGEGEFELSFPIDPVEIFRTMITDGATDDDLLSVLDNLIQFHLYHRYNYSARLSYHIPSGMGSQNQETEAQVLRAKLTLDTAAQQWNRWDEEPYRTHVTFETVREWNPDYPQDEKCKCGHPYHRHFDGYENNEAVGCKYCDCYTFEPVDNDE